MRVWRPCPFRIRLRKINSRGEFIFGLMKALGDLAILSALRIELGHAMGKLFLLLFERPDIVEHGHAFRKDGAARKR